MYKLGFKHQYHIYHLRLAINERIKKFLKQKDIEYRIHFKKENEKISEYKLDKLIKKEIEMLKNEINIYKQLLFKLFEQQTYYKANSYVNLLKNEINKFSDVLKNYLKKDFFPEYKKFIWFLKLEFKEKLMRTDNNSEMYFHATLPKAKKNDTELKTEYLIRYSTEKMAG